MTETTEKGIISVKMENKTIDAMEKQWRIREYKNRSQYVEHAVKVLNESTECPFCGAINPRGSRICAVCLRPLTAKDEEHILVSLAEKKSEEL